MPYTMTYRVAKGAYHSVIVGMHVDLRSLARRYQDKRSGSVRDAAGGSFGLGLDSDVRRDVLGYDIKGSRMSANNPVSIGTRATRARTSYLSVCALSRSRRRGSS